MTIRVLVADDSSFVRRAVTRMLAADSEIVVVGHAAHAAEVLAQIHASAPDVVTLDLQMPGNQGLETLRRIMRERPVPVVLLSAHARSDAQITLDALEAGAVDFVDKSTASPMNVYALADELIRKIKAAARSRPRPDLTSDLPPPVSAAAPSDIGAIVLGASTGGPPLIQLILSRLPRDLGIPIAVVQHMPSPFTRAFAERLDTVCALDVKEAEEGDAFIAERVFVAPGGRHFGLKRAGGKIEVTLAPRDDLAIAASPSSTGSAPGASSSFVPSIDHAASSIAAIYGGGTLCAILTGMGTDGVHGARAVQSAGGIVVAQSEATCVIYGMPRAVVREGLATFTLSPDEMISLILRVARRRPPIVRAP